LEFVCPGFDILVIILYPGKPFECLNLVETAVLFQQGDHPIEIVSLVYEKHMVFDHIGTIIENVLAVEPYKEKRNGDKKQDDYFCSDSDPTNSHVKKQQVWL